MGNPERLLNTAQYPFINKSVVTEYLPCVEESIALWEDKKQEKVKQIRLIKSKTLRMIAKLLKKHPDITKEEILIQVHYSVQKLIEHDPFTTVLKSNRLNRNFIPTANKPKIANRAKKIYERSVLDKDEANAKLLVTLGEDIESLNTGKTVIIATHPQLTTLALPVLQTKDITDLSEENFHVVIGIKPEVAATALFDEGKLLSAISNILICLPSTDNATVPGTESYAKRFNVGFARAVKNILENSEPAVIVEAPQGQRDIRLSSGRLLIPHLPPQTKAMMEKLFLQPGINIILAGFNYDQEFNWKHVTGIKKQKINPHFKFIKNAHEMDADTIMSELARVASGAEEQNAGVIKKQTQVIYPSKKTWDTFSRLYLQPRKKSENSEQ